MTQQSDDPAERLRRGLHHRAAGPELSDDVLTGAPHRTPPRVVDPRRRLQIAGGAVAAVAAVAAGALVVAPTFQRAPLFVAAGSSPSSAFGASADAATAESRIANWVEYDYVPGEGLSTEGGRGDVYELRLSGSAEDVLARTADAFGVDGDPAETSYFDPEYPSYVVGPEDGSAPSVVVSWVGTGNWWFSDPTAFPPIQCEPTAPDAETAPDAPVEDTACLPATPAPGSSLAPSESEARELARDLFARTGLDVDAADIRVAADEMQTTATAGLVVDGTATALEWSVAWSSTGDIAWASGHSVEVVDRGAFDTVSPADAVGRLADWRWFGAAGPDYQGGAVAYAADAVRSDVAPADEAPATDPGTEPAPPVEPAPDVTTQPGVEPQPKPTVDPEPEPTGTIEPGPEATILPEPLPEPTEPEVVEVTVDEAESTLLLVWDADGDAWLVPGYAMPHPDGWWNAVISLVDGVIQLPEPMEVEPLILED